ncbi:MAG TPA: hypothetical protein VGA78_15305 [Gemmatimonadales bacterium]
MRMLIVLALAAAVPASLVAQETAPLVLRLPASARAAALGNGFAGGRGSEMIFYHPAQIGLVTGLSLSLARYRASATFASLATSSTVGVLVVAAGVQWLDYGSEPGVFPTSPRSLTTSGSEISQSLAASAAAAIRLIGFRWGIAAKYVEERLPDARPSGAAFDVGVGRDFSRISVGLVAQNLGADIGREPARADLPTRLVLGAATPRYPIHTWFDIAATAAVNWERHSGVSPAAGAELTYVPLEGFALALRAGARRVTGGPSSQQPVTFGAGFSFDRLSLDYAYDGAHWFGVRMQ